MALTIKLTQTENPPANQAIRLLTMCFGLFAGFGGVEHGYFEFLQGNAVPESFSIASLGPPCVPTEVWHVCEPALTILPTFFLTGIVSMVLGVVTMVWSILIFRRRRGGGVLALLSFALLLFGGGIFPPLIGLVGGIVGIFLNKPLDRWRDRHGIISQLLANSWPWLLVAFFVWLFGQVVIGFFFNDWLMQTGLLIPVVILGLLALSVLSAFAHDTR